MISKSVLIDVIIFTFVQMEFRNFLILYAVSFTIAAPVDTNNTQPGEDGKPKRGLSELSYSYAATDIGAKGGTRIKTITIIKNFKDTQKDKTLKINPELHKDEEWGSKFRDNFESFGKIPEVPEIENFAFIKEEPQRQEIPIYEMSKMENENDKLIVDNEELTDQGEEKIEENQKPEQNKEMFVEIDQEGMKPLNSKEELPEDVEIIETDGGKKVKFDKNGPKSQPLIAFGSLRNGKQQKYTSSISSSLNTHPYHLLAQTKNSNSKLVSQKQSTTLNPYKLSELYKLPYSPLLFPPIPIPAVTSNANSDLAEISSTTPCSPRTQFAATSMLPYFAPYKSRNTSSNPLPNKSSHNFGPRSRGLRY